MNERREELEIRDIINECLALFEGGEIREDFDTPYAHWMIADIVDTLDRFKRIIRQREDGRQTLEQMQMIWTLDRFSDNEELGEE